MDVKVIGLNSAKNSMVYNTHDNDDSFEPHMLINTKSLNVRSGNGRDNRIVGVLNTYDSIIVTDCIEASYGGDVWCKIDSGRPYNNFVGWVNSDFIGGVETMGVSYKVMNIPMNDTLTIRQGNSIITHKVGFFARNARGVQLQMCAINAQKKEWCKINYPNFKGWVMKKYITTDF